MLEPLKEEEGEVMFFEEDVMPDEEIDSLINDLAGVKEKKSKKKKGGGGSSKKKVKTHLTEEEEEILQDAQKAFIDFDYDMCIELCNKVCKNDSRSPRPYNLLFLCYEGKGDIYQQANAGLIEAQLDSTRDQSKWKLLAQLYRKVKCYERALFCYSKSIRINPKDVDDIWDKSLTYMDLGYPKRALNGFLSILKREGMEHDLQVVKEIAILYHKHLNNTNAAITLLKDAISKNYLDYGAINILCELMISTGDYEGARNTCLESSLDESERPIDLWVRIGVCSIYLKDIATAKKTLKQMETFDIEEISDLYVELIDAYYNCDEFKEALALCEILMENGLVDANLCYLQGKCEISLENYDAAAILFSTVLEAPTGLGESEIQNTRLMLANAYSKSGRADKALSILEPDPESDEINGNLSTRVFLERCTAILKIKDYAQFLEVAKPRMYKMMEYASQEHARCGVTVWREAYSRHLSGWLWLTVDIVRVLVYLEEYEEAKAILQKVYELKHKWKNMAEQRHLLLVFDFVMYLKQENFAVAKEKAKGLMARSWHIPGFWELMQHILLKVDNYGEVQKSLIKYRSRHPDCIPLVVLHAHANMLTSSVSHGLAIGEYLHAHLIDNENDQIMLFLAIVFLLDATKRSKVNNKRFSVFSAFTFLLRYYEKREGDREALYNVGRAYHHIGLYHVAHFFYEKALENIPYRETGSDVIPEYTDNITRESAYNLSLIYRHSGNADLARLMLYRYCSI